MKASLGSPGQNQATRRKRTVVKEKGRCVLVFKESKYVKNFQRVEAIIIKVNNEDIYWLKAGVHLKAVFPPLNLGLMRISRSRFKQSKNSLLISQIYVLR